MSAASQIVQSTKMGRKRVPKFLGDGSLPQSFEIKIDTTSELTVLIYGSHRIAVDGLRHMIEGLGQPVMLTTMDPAVMMKEVKNQKIGLVIFDLYHRTEAVFELASSLRRVSKQTQVLFMIDEPTLDELRLAIRNGVLGFFRKKSLKPVLTDIIRRVANGEAQIDGSLLARFLQSLGPHENGATSSGQNRAHQLSDLDREILARTASGDSSRQIAADCGFSAGFIRNRLSAIYRTLGVSNKTQAAVFAVRIGIAYS